MVFGNRSVHGVVTVAGGCQISATVCEPCKRRKKGCDKVLPSCGRCARLLARCSYSELNPNGNVANGLNGSPSLTDVVPDLVTPNYSYDLAPSQSELGVVPRSHSIEDSVFIQVKRLLGDISRNWGSGDAIRTCCEAYFRGFSFSLPVVNESVFWTRFEDDGWTQERGENTPTELSHFSTLVLAVFLISFLYPHQSVSLSTHEIYTTLKSIFALLQSTSNVSIEMVQIGLLLSSWEWCQDLQQDAWMTIGGCVRMAQVLGLHRTVKEELPDSIDERITMEFRRVLWWCCVVLERIIQAEPGNTSFPCASSPPHPNDFLPESVPTRVGDDLLLPHQVDLSDAASGLNRDFTKFGSFSAAVQATLLSELVMRHINYGSRSEQERTEDEMRLDIALQSFVGALIPGPGKSHGGFCGPFGIRTSAEFALHLYTISYVTNPNTIRRATSSIQSLSRIIVHTTKLSIVGMPMELDSLAFWSHKSLYASAIMHIKFADRDGDWHRDLEVMKSYLKMFESRMGIYANYVQQIEVAQHEASGS